jgi:CRISPR system Cascade subunit CasA
MPRRVRLLFEPANGRRCDLGGPADQVLVTGWETKQYGVKYEGWEHPLSPYTKKTGELSNPMKGSPGGVSYRHWLGLIVGDNSEGGRHPAACVDEFRERRAADSGIAGLRLLAFGYDMDNMKARAWYEAEMPIPNVSAAKREGFDKTIAKLIGGANMAARLTMSSVKRALHDRPADAKGDYSFIADRFWHDTETSFFNYLRELAAGDAGDDDRMLREGWLRDMRRAALTIFDDTVPTEGFENVKWRRIVQARQGLIWTLDGDDIRVKQLGLPARERHKARSTGLKKESKK